MRMNAEWRPLASVCRLRTTSLPEGPLAWIGVMSQYAMTCSHRRGQQRSARLSLKSRPDRNLHMRSGSRDSTAICAAAAAVFKVLTHTNDANGVNL